MKCNNGNKCAVPCDGITECAGGEDENGCKSMWTTLLSFAWAYVSYRLAHLMGRQHSKLFANEVKHRCHFTDHLNKLQVHILV